jgi:phosphoribosyl 1,2-cyclic phosphodiesterase
VLVLGVAQDAGVPQMGCETPFCVRARQDAKLRRMVSSIAVVDPDSGSRWIFDATPDLPEQFEMLKSITGDRSNRIDGIFLTHAHIGHYTGLMYLELLAEARTAGLPVRLRVFRVNPAQRLYRRLGFVVTGETETHVQMEHAD